MKEKLSVSICIPVYNTSAYIIRCAKSLFEQTYENIDYIFVNDCSTDDSMSLLANIMDEYPNRKPHVTIINHSQNRGLSAARNSAISCCSGDFIIHVDSDDYLALDAIDHLMKKQQETGADIVSGQVVRLFQGKTVMMERPHFCNSDDFIEDMIVPSFHHTIWGRLIRASIYRKNKIKAKEGVNIGEDLQIMPQLAFYAQKVESIWEVVYYYDCTNEKSYMNQYSQVNLFRLRQDTASMEIVRDFFVGKKDKFLNLAERYLYDYYWTLLETLGKDISREDFSEIKKRLSLLNSSNCKKSIKRTIKMTNYHVFVMLKYIAKWK